MIKYAIICFIVVLAWDVITDHRKLLNNKPVKHTKEAWVRAALLLPCLFLFGRAHNAAFFLSFPLSLGMIFFNYWNLFDGFYNVMRRDNWFYLGSVDPDDAKSDKLLRGLPLWTQATIKLGGSALFIIAYITTYHG